MKLYFLPRLVGDKIFIEDVLKKAGKNLRTGTIKIVDSEDPEIWIDKKWKSIAELSNDDRGKIKRANERSP